MLHYNMKPYEFSSKARNDVHVQQEGNTALAIIQSEPDGTT